MEERDEKRELRRELKRREGENEEGHELWNGDGESSFVVVCSISFSLLFILDLTLLDSFPFSLLFLVCCTKVVWFFLHTLHQWVGERSKGKERVLLN